MEEGAMTLDEWVDVVRTEFGLGPVDRDLVLDLAKDVAHGVARPAAPLTAYLAGLAAGSAGGSPADTKQAVARIRALIPPSSDGD
jgi:hypothetical protein